MTGPLISAAVGRRVAAAFGANVLGRVIAIGVQIAGPALFLWCWSVGRYGDWLLLTALPGALAAADFGFCAAAANEMTICAARSDPTGVRRVFGHALGLILLIGTAIAAVAISLLLVTDPAGLLGLSAIGRDEARAVLIILTAQVLLGLPGELLLGGFRAGHRFAEGLMVANLMSLIEFVVAAAALLLFGTPIALAAAALAAQLLRLTVTAGRMRRCLDWPDLPPPRVSPAEIRRMVPPALGFAAVPLGRAAINQGLVILIGLLADSRVVVAFTTTRTAARLVSTLAGIAINAVLSELTVAWASDRRDIIRALFFAVGRLTVWSGLAAGLALALGREPLALLWLHGAVDLALPLLLPLIAAELAYALHRAGFTLVAAANRHAGLALAICLVSLAGLGPAALLIREAGTAGAGWSVLLIEVLTLALTLPGATALAGTTIPVFLTRCLVPPWRALQRPW